MALGYYKDGAWVSLALRAELAAKVDSPPASGTNRFITMPGNVSFGGANSPVAGRLNAAPFFVPVDCTLNRIDISVSTAGSTGAIARLGIYSSSADFKPESLLEQGTVSAETTGIKSLTISVAATSGWYWVAAASQGSPVNIPGFRRLGPSTIMYPDGINLNEESTRTARVVSFGDAVFPNTYPAYDTGFQMINCAIRYST